MKKEEVLRLMDDWANFYLWILGDAKHMDFVDNGRYCAAFPKEGQKGINSIFNIRLENLSDEELSQTVNEIKEMKKHTWWNQYSDHVNRVAFPEGRKVCSPDDWEVYAVMLPHEKPDYPANSIDIKKVGSLGNFADWCKIENQYEFHSEDLHPENHYHHCLYGAIHCYVAYENNLPIAVAGIMDNKQGVCSLEFVSTVTEYRQKGFATAVCQAVITEAFANGAKVITVRAYGDNGKKLGKSLGFKYI